MTDCALSVLSHVLVILEPLHLFVMWSAFLGRNEFGHKSLDTLVLQKDRSGLNAEGVAVSHFPLSTSGDSDGFSSHQIVFWAGCGQDTKPMRPHLYFCHSVHCEGQLWCAFSCRYVGMQVERHAKRKKAISKKGHFQSFLTLLRLIYSSYSCRQPPPAGVCQTWQGILVCVSWTRMFHGLLIFLSSTSVRMGWLKGRSLLITPIWSGEEEVKRRLYSSFYNALKGGWGEEGVGLCSQATVMEGEVTVFICARGGSGWVLGKFILGKSSDALVRAGKGVVDSLSPEVFQNCGDVALSTGMVRRCWSWIWG